MDCKEVKQALKEAREAIRLKDFKAALKHCKIALKLDKECYMAWVLVGAAAQEIDQLDQAVAAFKKAAGISPDKVFAWQGMCSLYEKHPNLGDFENDRHNVYLKLIEMTENDPGKQVEMADKLTSHYRSQGDVDKYISALDQCMKLIPPCPELIKLWQSLVDFSKDKVASYSTDHQNLLLRAHEQLTFAPGVELPRREALCRTYVDVLLQAGQKELVSKEVRRFGSSFPDSSVPLEVLCGMYVDSCLHGWEDAVPFMETDAILELISRKPKLQVGWLAQATHLHAKGQHELAMEALAKVAEIGRGSREAHLLLSLCSLALHNFRRAEVHAKNGLSCTGTAGDWLSRRLLLCLARSLCGQHCCEEAAQVLDQLGEECAEVVPVLWCSFEVSLLSGHLDKCEKVLGKLSASLGSDPKLHEARAALLICRGNFEEALRILTDHQQCSPKAMHLKAVALWELGQRAQAVQSFLEAARMDPGDYRNFIYLGRNYLTLADKQKALRCFQKAFELNRTSEEAGSLLSDVLCDLGCQDQNAKFLEAVTSQLVVRRAKWAWLRLGLLQLSRGAAAEAVPALQNALSADTSDKHCWECLGEAYLQRESLGAARLCFKKCLEMDPRDLFSLYQMATIKSRQGELKEAAADFASALEVDSNYVPVLKGLAETRLALARRHLEQGLCGLGLDDCQVAVETLSRAISVRGQLVCLWKLLADACLLPSIFGLTWATLRLPEALLDDDLRENGPGQLLKASQRFYMKAIGFKPRLASLWHDLGLALLLEAKLRGEGYGQALASLRNAVSLDPQRHGHWNSLGVLALSTGKEGYALAQHSFIKSVQLESDNPVAWTNLGALYLLAGNVQLAHKAFAKAQSLEPTAVQPWVGQGLIAELVKHHDTTDLFRHCTSLGNHAEAASGYARWLCAKSSSLGTRARDILVIASDALSRVVDLQGKRKAPLLNMLGLLLEQQGLLRSARDSYRRALGAPDQFDGSLQDAQFNLARALCRLGEFDEAVELCLQVEPRTKDLLCLLGYLHDRRNETDQALKAYEEALPLTSDDKRADVVLAMAMVMLRAHGPSAAKDLLLSRLRGETWSHNALEVLFCLGLLTSDDATCQQALDQLAMKNSASVEGRMANLVCYQHLLKDGDMVKARRLLSRAIHLHPASSKNWSALAQLLLRACDPGSVPCMLAASVLGDRSPRLLALLVVARILQGKTKHALRSAQKLLFLHPDSLIGWVLLGAALSACRSPCDKALRHDRFLLGASSHWNHWSALVQVQYACSQKQWRRASELVPLVLWGYAGDPDVALLLEIVQAVCDSLAKDNRLSGACLDLAKNLVSCKETPATLLMLSQLQVQAGDLCGSLETIEKAKTHKAAGQKLLELELRRALLSLRLAKVNSGSGQDQLQAAMAALNAALRINPKCRAGHLLLGVWATESDKERLAKKSLERVMRFEDYECSWPRIAAAKMLLPQYLQTRDTAKLQNLLERIDWKSSLELNESQMSQLISMGFIDGSQ